MAVFGHREDKSKVNLLEFMYPVGSIYMSVNPINPSSLFGGTWERWGNGRVPVGVDTTQAEFNATEKTGGEKTHVLNASEMPNHDHSYSRAGKYDSFVEKYTTGNVGVIASSGGGIGSGSQNHNHILEYSSNTTGKAGSSSAHNNLQPYITCYMWKRTA